MAQSATPDYAEQALALPIDLRVRLVERLLESLHGPVPPEIEAAWAEESERRLDRLLSGEDKTISADEDIARLRARNV